MNELALFAGAGGGILGGSLLGWRTVCAVEWEPYPASVLCARQNDGILPFFPIWDDVCTFDGKPWRGIVDVVSGGFPCQDISSAGGGAGITGSRSGLWKEMARIIGEVRPKYAFIENSPMLTLRGLDTVLCDLAAMGFDANWGVVSAADVGAPHLRERIWIVAHSNSHSKSTQPVNAEQICQSDMAHSNGINWGRKSQQSDNHCGETIRNEFGRGCSEMAHPNSAQCERSCVSSRIQSSESNISSYGGNENFSDTASERQSGQREHEQPFNSAESCNGETNNVESIRGSKFWATEPNVGRVANGVASRVDRLKAIGNGQVPAVAATAFKLLSEGL